MQPRPRLRNSHGNCPTNRGRNRGNTELAFSTREDTLVVARSLLPALRERTGRCATDRSLASETLDDLRRAGLLRVATPPSLGGFGLGIDVGLEIAMELARGCSSTGWVFGQFIIHNWNAARLDSAAREAYFSKPDIACATAIAMLTCEIQDAPGGLLVNGRWRLSSGIDHADWLWIMTFPSERYGGALIPAGDFALIDDWDVIGLSGTGSKEVYLQEVFVPTERLIERGWEQTFLGGGDPFYEEDPTYGVAPSVWGPWASSCLIGTGRAMIDVFESGTINRKDSVTGRRCAEDPLIHVVIAESSAEVDCAANLFYHDMAELRRVAESGNEIDLDVVFEVARNSAYACRLLLRSGQRLYEHFGSSVIYDNNLLRQLFGDILTGTRHAIFSWEYNAEQYGRTRFGLGPLSIRGTSPKPPTRQPPKMPR